MAKRIVLVVSPLLHDKRLVVREPAQAVAAASGAAVLRERQACDLTLGWPVLRRCAFRMGENLASRGFIDVAEEGFFLLRVELSGREDLRKRVAERKQRWEKQCRLAALSATRGETYTVGYPPSKP